MTVASLPMYDLPEIVAATNTWWKSLVRAFRREGIDDVPDELWRGVPYREPWTRADLLLSQTCGYPLTHELAAKVSLVATPCYSAPGCQGSDYCSIVVVHKDSTATNVSEMRDKTCAINGRDSQSGYNSLRALIAPLTSGNRFFRDVIISGGHANSLKLVSDGEADIAAVDCVTYALLARDRPQAVDQLRPLCNTAPAPSLPYITNCHASIELLERLRNGLQEACLNPELANCREILMLKGFCTLPIAEYDRITEMEKEAIISGYKTLR